MELLLVFLKISGLFTLFSVIACFQTFLFEKMNRFGLGNRAFILNDRKSYPEPLPASKPNKIEQVHSPYKTLYQGVKRKTDVRVYYKKFRFQSKPFGHHIFCKGQVKCKISHLAVETTGGFPIILRGGVGYDYFDVIARAKPSEQLVGNVKAYCRNETNSYYEDKPKRF